MKTSYAKSRDEAKLPAAKMGETLSRVLASRPHDSRESSVTLSWGIAWDEGEIARDLLQNFRDANKDRMQEITIAVDGDAVMVRGPATCEIERKPDANERVSRS